MRYQYTARAIDGRRIAGVITAPGAEEAAGHLQEAGVYPTSVVGSRSARPARPLERLCCSEEERIFLLESLIVYLEAGFTFSSALLRLSLRAKKPHLAGALEEALQAVEEGDGLVKALKKASLFPPSWLSILSLGEIRGDLLPSLKLLRQYAMESLHFKREILCMLMQPAIVLILVGVWFWVVVNRVVPTLQTFLGCLGTVSPASVILSGLSGAVHLLAPLVFPLACVLFLLFHGVLRNDHEGSGLTRWFARLPGAGSLFERLKRVIVFSGFKLHLEAGIPILHLMGSLSDTLPDPKVREELRQALGQLRQGVPLSEAMACLELIQPADLALLSAGEASGRLVEMFDYLLNQTQEELKTQIKRLAILLRGFIAVSTGILIGLVMISFLWLVTSTMAGAIQTVLGGYPSIGS